MNSKELIQSEQRRRLRQEVSRAERFTGEFWSSTAFSYCYPVYSEFNSKRWRGERRQAALFTGSQN